MLDMIKRIIDEIGRYRDASDAASEKQIALWNNVPQSDQPLLLRCGLSAEEQAALPSFNYKEIHYDKDKMFLSQLRDAVKAAKAGRESVPSVRANMGASVFPSILGVMPMLFEDKMPWVKQHIGKEALARMDPDRITLSEEFKAGLEHMVHMADALENTGCLVYPMDLQGPVDTAHIVYGDRFFYDLYDDPDFIHHLLDLCCRAIEIGMEACLSVIPESDRRVAHYNNLVMPREKGGLKISEDTSTLLSKEHIEEFVAPYTHRVLAHFGGGYIHYCGKNPHLFETVMNEKLAFGLNFGNPDMHDMVSVVSRCAREGKIFYGFIDRRGETTEEFFRKYLYASEKNGMRYLLLNYDCAPEEREEVLSAWSAAQK